MTQYTSQTRHIINHLETIALHIQQVQYGVSDRRIRDWAFLQAIQQYETYKNNNVLTSLNKGGDKEKNQTFVSDVNMNIIPQGYIDYLCGKHPNRNTRKNKETSIRKFLSITQGEITKETVQQWRIWANQHYDHNTINNRINAINEYLRWTGNEELQMRHIGFKETNQYSLTEEEIDSILQASQDNPETYLMVLFLWDGCLRPSEIIGIKTTNRIHNKLYLDDTKTGDKRIILSNNIQQAWDNYLPHRPQPLPEYMEYLFINNNRACKGRKYYDTWTIVERVKHLGLQCNIGRKVMPYTIRRTSATLRRDIQSKYYTGDSKIVQLMFHHRDIKTTKRYDIKTDRDIEKYFHALDKPPCNMPQATDKPPFALDKSYK